MLVSLGSLIKRRWHTMIKLTSSLRESLTNFATSNNMSLRELAQVVNMALEHDSLLKQHNAAIWQNEKDKRWRTHLPNGKLLVKTKKEDLENAVVDYYRTAPMSTPAVPLNLTSSSITNVATPQSNCTLKTLYPQWYELRKYEVSPNTLADDISNWEKYISNSEIADIPLNQLSRSKLKAWANQLITKYSMKKKYYSNIRSVLNSLLDFAVDEDLIDTNNFRNLKLNAHLFTPPTLKAENEEVFTPQEQKLVMQEAEEDSMNNHSAIPLGICLLFLTGMRVGELCGLRYGDIRDNSIFIQRMVVADQVETPDGLKQRGFKVVEHAKSSAGQRQIPLVPQARQYLEQIKKINYSNGYSTTPNDLIFQRDDGLCNQRVFECRIKKYCNSHHLNLPFKKSCHDIRRTYITNLFEKGLNADTIRRLAGHENIDMTMKYCRGRVSQNELTAILEKALAD